MKNLALKNKIPAQAVLQNFMLERLLERIILSKYKDIFILKGGMLIASMIGIGSRTTMDMDTTLRGYPLSLIWWSQILVLQRWKVQFPANPGYLQLLKNSLFSKTVVPVS